MSDYLFIWHCAAMSNDVYYDNPTGNWTRIPGLQKKAGDDGFFGSAYNDGDQNVVLAVRGTQEQQDAFDDVNMAPVVNGDQAKKIIGKLVEEYIKGYSYAQAAPHRVGNLAKLIFDRNIVRTKLTIWGGQVPPTQALMARAFAQQVSNYCKAKNLKLRCFTGHSLGGALAQYLSEQTGDGGETHISENIPAVVFNSPNMGNLNGMRKGKGGGILVINARLDPLSNLTRLVGNKSHAMDKDHEFSEIDVGRPSPPPRFMEPATPNELESFLGWFFSALGHYHSMPNMVSSMLNGAPGNRSLSSFFPKAY